MNSPRDPSETASTFLAIDFLFSTKEHGGALGEITEREENRLPFRTAKVVVGVGGGDSGEQGWVGREKLQVKSGGVHVLLSHVRRMAGSRFPVVALVHAERALEGGQET